MGIYFGNESVGIPEGSIISFAGNTEPAGWLFCDGRVCERAGIYAQLFNAIGITYNTGGETGTQFRLPDLRNQFVRGKAADRALGSKQEDAMRDISGSFRVPTREDGYGGNQTVTGSFSKEPMGHGYEHHGWSGSKVKLDLPAYIGTEHVANEFRPVNIALNYIIKY
jgi:microcystin-dependent protein